MTKRRTGPDEYLSARDVARKLRITPNPQLPGADIVIGTPGTPGSGYGYLPATVEAIRNGTAQARKPYRYLSRSEAAAELGVTPVVLRVWHHRYPGMPEPDVVIGAPAARGARYGYLGVTVEEIRVWEATRHGEGAPARPKSKAHREALAAAHQAHWADDERAASHREALRAFAASDAGAARDKAQKKAVDAYWASEAGAAEREARRARSSERRAARREARSAFWASEAGAARKKAINEARREGMRAFWASDAGAAQKKARSDKAP